nr:integrase, catalytic region, zinc finger, CCHC-type, peptidase aspartic, catalytic [Tanacetum cinerariifolium]
MIKRVYYVEGLNHNLFSVGQFCYADLEVTFRKSTCFIRDLKGNDLLIGSHGMNLYSITLQDMNCPNPICLMAKATSSQAWLWHRHLFHLNFDTINLLSKNDIVVGLRKLKFVKDHLCSSCELGKAKRKDGENLDKMKEKGDECIFVGYSTQSRAYRVFNKRTRVTLESIHVNFDELPHMASDHVGSDLASECQRMALEHDSLSPTIKCQANVPQADRTVTTSNELDLLFSLMFDELLNGSSKVVSKSSSVSSADASNQLHHNVYTPSSSIPQVENAPSVNQQPDFSQQDSGLIVLVFQKEVLMIEFVSDVETDMVIHTVKNNMMKLVVEIECFGMSTDEFDKETGSSDGLQPKQSNLNCVHALNEPHLREIHVVL